MDESTNASVDISIAKAKHAAYYRRESKFHETLLASGNNIVLSLPNSMPIMSICNIMLSVATTLSFVDF